MKSRIKEINYEIFQQAEIIKLARKKIKELQIEKADLEGQQRLEKIKKVGKKKWN